MIVLVDGSALLIKYYYGTNQIFNKNNQNINGIVWFFRALKKFNNFDKLTKIVVLLDGAHQNFRKKLYKNYKSNRKPLEDDLKFQLSILQHECIKNNISAVNHPNYEADDLIASYATKLKEEEIIIVSNDKDLYQLIDDRVAVWNHKHGIFITKEYVYDKFGVFPDQLHDFLSMVGDAADNIPGIKGIGPKTASLMIQNHDNMKDIINIYNGKYNFDQISLWQELIALKKEIDIISQPSSIDINHLNKYINDITN